MTAVQRESADIHVFTATASVTDRHMVGADGEMRRGGTPEPGIESDAVYRDHLGIDAAHLLDLTDRGAI